MREGMDREGIARSARTRHEDRLLAIDGVVSVGVGLDDEGLPALVVGVVSSSALLSVLPRELDGARVIIREVGDLRAENGSGQGSR